ncbi:MAG TPA: metallophosphoesterase, partial [Stellaceae bacterium]|nr:metallophosphoesterase [Stellaceae bacterium]
MIARHFWIVAILLAASPAWAETLGGPWVELGADGRLSVRVVVPSGVAACPRVVADGTPVEPRQRGAADGDFAVTVCVADVPAATGALTIDDKPLPTLPAGIKRIAIFGDTGCRIAGKALQNCNDPNQWPFPVIAKQAAARKPDLVIHVGDYLYREGACPAGRAGCAGSPFGDNWPTWKADFFDPAAPLFAAAPWVVVRGNHEVCRRAGPGWFRLLDPHPARPDCADRTDPYRLSIGGLELLLFDGADADDFVARPDKVAAYSQELASLLAKAPPHSWLLTHRPVWAMAQADLAGLTTNQTEQ